STSRSGTSSARRASTPARRCRRSRRSARRRCTRSLCSSRRRRGRSRGGPLRIFLGITGASGAPYAARLLESLAAADWEIGVCASRAGVEVLATELYGDARLSADETLQRLLEHAGGKATLYDAQDWRAPYASGSAKVDAYVICPCSMGTLGTIASGA